jgi:hypothetical protein
MDEDLQAALVEATTWGEDEFCVRCLPDAQVIVRVLSCSDQHSVNCAALAIFPDAGNRDHPVAILGIAGLLEPR